MLMVLLLCLALARDQFEVIVILSALAVITGA
jgi:hypothetical protein